MNLEQETDRYVRVSDEDVVTETEELDEEFDEEELDEDEESEEDEGEDEPVSNQSLNEDFAQVMARRIERRTFLKGAAATASLLVVSSEAMTGQVEAAAPLGFTPVQLSTEDRIQVPLGYQSDVVIRWGDPIRAGAPSFNFAQQSAGAQAQQFGYNCDFLYAIPYKRNSLRTIARAAESYVLWVNHEYTNPELMFAGYQAASTTKELVDIELAAHGGTVVAIELTRRGLFLGGEKWTVDLNSPLNRRITAETEMIITGPAAGSDLLKTSADTTGTRVRGMLNNCGGGITPWGTIISAEENFNQYFANLNNLPATDSRRAIHARYGMPTGASERRWENFYDRFDIGKEPNEAFRFGYAVEIDILNPNSTPKKRTALGRLKHEAATFVTTTDGRVVAYTGDDERFDYMYKFVTNGKLDPLRGSANGDLLDDGTLYVAKFNSDGAGEWLPLVGGQGALATWTQAQVCVNTRGAADLVGATKMDRPEDIETNPVNGKVYAVFTNNTQRGGSGRPAVDAPNPRANNRHGHIIEITEAGNNATATSFKWEIFMLCGDPAVAAEGTYWAGWQGGVSPISSPDNITFDKAGNLWIATDGQINTFRKNDGIYVVPVEGSDRGYLRQFMSGIPGGEVASLALSPDNRTLFASIQHPGEGSTYDSPTSSFPDGGKPRPAVVAVRKGDGGLIGS
ncbi:MAG: PhoX family protein [Blastocatellia bacterium]